MVETFWLHLRMILLACLILWGDGRWWYDWLTRRKKARRRHFMKSRTTETVRSCDYVLYVICLALSNHKNYIGDKSFTFKNLVQAFVQLDFICYLLYISSHVINSKFEHKDLSTHTYSLLIHTLFPFCFLQRKDFF